jgi:uncharacterized protein YjbI with pentapeptide repeats
LRDSAEEDEVRKIARVRTLTVLPRLDADRKMSVLQFLYESGLINKDKLIIDLSGANLFQADLLQANLSNANLSAANLSPANLDGANLSEADLSGAFGVGPIGAVIIRANLNRATLSGVTLIEANLNGVSLSEADISGADLRDAKNITIEELEKQAKSLKGATMPDGSIHD